MAPGTPGSRHGWREAFRNSPFAIRDPQFAIRNSYSPNPQAFKRRFPCTRRQAKV